jgi:hypothetical protein
MAKTDSLGAYFDKAKPQNDEFSALLYAMDIDESEVKHFHTVGLITRMVPFLQDPKNIGIPIEVLGICSNTGTAAHNQVLSEQRADEVVKELVTVHGIAEERIIARGTGILKGKFGSPELNDTDAPGENRIHRGTLVIAGPLKGITPPSPMTAPLDDTLNNDEFNELINAL